MDFDLRAETIDRLRDAEINEIYYRRRGDHLATADRWTRLLTLVTASATVAGWASTFGAGTWFEGWWKVASVVAALAALASTVWRLSDRAREARELAASWTALVGELRRLDAEVRSDQGTLDRYLLLQGQAETLQGRDLEPSRATWIADATAVVNARHADRAPL